MERKMSIVLAVQNAIDGLNLNAKVVRVSINGFKILSDCADAVAELISKEFCESLVAEVMSEDMVICYF